MENIRKYTENEMHWDIGKRDDVYHTQKLGDSKHKGTGKCGNFDKAGVMPIPTYICLLCFIQVRLPPDCKKTLKSGQNSLKRASHSSTQLRNKRVLLRRDKLQAWRLKCFTR